VDELKASDKPFQITKMEVWDAWLKVRGNQGAPGVDGVSIEMFEKDLKNNLYRIWNRMSSGTYFPPPVRAVESPKPHGGGIRVLGVPLCGGQNRADCGSGPVGENGGTGVPSGFLRVPAWEVATGCGWDLPEALLGVRLGDRS
jgi:hypothetical protein